mgnify:CR=1 FL=1
MVGTIQIGTEKVFHTPQEVLQSALADSVLFLEKATVGRAQISDISDALAEYKRLFSVKLASPAEILTLARAYPDNQKYAKAADKLEDDNMPVVVGGPASIEMVDREGHLITTNALTKAFAKYMDNFRTRNTMVMHSDVQVGWALPAYITKGGSVFRSGVDPRGLFFITELRNDTRIAAKVKDQIESGKMRSYSIAGNATESKDIHKEDGTKIMQVNNLELAEVTICEKGVNQGAHFDLMKGMIVDQEESTSTPVSSSDLLLEETLNKALFKNPFKKPSVDIDWDDPKVHQQVQDMKAKSDAKIQDFHAQSDKLDAAMRNYENTPPPKMSQGTSDALAEINALSASNKAKAPKIEESLNKGITDKLGISQRARDTKAVKNFRSRYQEGGEAHEGVSNMNEKLTGIGAKPVAPPSTVRRVATEMYNKQRSKGSTPKEAAQYSDNVTANAVSRTGRRIAAAHLGKKYGLNKSTPMLGIFQEFMQKEKPSTDTPLGHQTVHPDRKGEEERKKQLKRVQQEFGLPEETEGAEYNRYAHVDYKHPHSFTSARVVNQSGQDLASAQIGEHPIDDTIDRLNALSKGQEGGKNGFQNLRPNWEFTSPGDELSSTTREEYSQDESQLPDKKAVRQAAAAARIRDKYLPQTIDEKTGKRNPDLGGPSTIQNMQTIDKVLAKALGKAGPKGMPEVGADQQNQKYKEDRTPGNAPKPNEFPADSSPSPYQSKGLFEKAGDDMRQDGITNHPPRRSPVTKREDDRTFTPGHFEKQHRDTADIDRSTMKQRAAQEARHGAADIPPEDPEFEYESGYGPYDDRIDPVAQAAYKQREADEKRAEQGGEGWSRGEAPSPASTSSRTPLDRPAAPRTGTTSRGVRQEGGAGRKASFDRSQRKVYGVKGKQQRPTKYKDVDRSAATPMRETDYAPPALKNSIQKQVRPQRGTGVRTSGMPTQRGQQGPTTAWGDPTRAAKPTMRQQMPWDEKSLEKNEGEGKTSPPKPSLKPARVPTHDEAAAAANRKRVEETQGKPSATPYRSLPWRERIAEGADAERRLDERLKTTDKNLTKSDPKAILIKPYNSATQMIMGKKAPAAVSADDRLKASLLVLLKQTAQPTAQEVGASLINTEGDTADLLEGPKGLLAGAKKLIGVASKKPAEFAASKLNPSKTPTPLKPETTKTNDSSNV